MEETNTTAVEARLDRIAADLAWLVERQRKQAELIEEMQPILKQAMGVTTERLQKMEEQGWFRFGRSMGTITERIVTTYSDDDLNALTDNVIKILDTVRALTQPDVLEVVGDAVEVVQDREKVAPLGVVGMVRATSDVEVQRGMAVMMELLRHLGRAANTMSRRPPPARPAKRALDPNRPRRTGVERPQKKEEAPASCARPTAPGPTATTVGGVGFTADGFLSDPKQWSRELATAIAQSAGVELSPAHWALVEFARKDWEETGISPNIRRLSTGANINTRDIYTLFKKAPGKTIARIAGIPKPAGCL